MTLDKMNEVDKYILNFRSHFINNPDLADVFFSNVLLNEHIFYKNLKTLSKQMFDASGAPVLTQDEIEAVINQSKSDTVSMILKELAATKLFFKTKQIDTGEPFFGVTPTGHLVADILLNEYKQN